MGNLARLMTERVLCNFPPNYAISFSFRLYLILHTRAVNIRCDKYCNNFLEFGVELKKASHDGCCPCTVASPSGYELWRYAACCKLVWPWHSSNDKDADKEWKPYRSVAGSGCQCTTCCRTGVSPSQILVRPIRVLEYARRLWIQG